MIHTVKTTKNSLRAKFMVGVLTDKVLIDVSPFSEVQSTR